MVCMVYLIAAFICLFAAVVCFVCLCASACLAPLVVCLHRRLVCSGRWFAMLVRIVCLHCFFALFGLSHGLAAWCVVFRFCVQVLAWLH